LKMKYYIRITSLWCHWHMQQDLPRLDCASNKGKDGRERYFSTLVLFLFLYIASSD